MFEVHSQFCTRSDPSLSILLEPPYSSVWQEHSPTRSALDSQNGWCQVGTGIAHSSPKASPPGPILTGPKFWFPSYDTSYDVGSSDPAYPSMASQSSSWAQQVEERPRQPVTHIFESFPSKSKSKRRRARHLKCVREPLPQILAISPAVRDDRFVGSELARADEWHALQQALLMVLEDPDQVQRAVALVESLFQREDQGSLGWWICQEVFHLSTHFDVTSILLILRGLETLRKSKPCGRRILQITSCNITTWRSEVKQWMATQEDVILVQEHHLLAPALSVEIEAMGAIGYDSFLMPASPGQGSRNSSQGGVGILVKTHLGARLRAQFSREGCGYVAVTIRTQGADLTLVSLYLQCSTGCAGPVNAAILSSLRDLRTRHPWSPLGRGRLERQSSGIIRNLDHGKSITTANGHEFAHLRGPRARLCWTFSLPRGPYHNHLLLGCSIQASCRSTNPAPSRSFPDDHSPATGFCPGLSTNSC